MCIAIEANTRELCWRHLTLKHKLIVDIELVFSICRLFDAQGIIVCLINTGTQHPILYSICVSIFAFHETKGSVSVEQVRVLVNNAFRFLDSAPSGT